VVPIEASQFLYIYVYHKETENVTLVCLLLNQQFTIAFFHAITFTLVVGRVCKTKLLNNEWSTWWCKLHLTRGLHLSIQLMHAHDWNDFNQATRDYSFVLTDTMLACCHAQFIFEYGLDDFNTQIWTFFHWYAIVDSLVHNDLFSLLIFYVSFYDVTKLQMFYVTYYQHHDVQK